MPSRFEPCGLNQMYSQRYGTLPLVTPVGGLFDTVIDNKTGFVMPQVSDTALLETIDRCLTDYSNKSKWAGMIKMAMQQDFSWRKSAEAYNQLYEQAIRDNPKPVER